MHTLVYKFNTSASLHHHRWSTIYIIPPQQIYIPSHSYLYFQSSHSSLFRMRTIVICLIAFFLVLNLDLISAVKNAKISSTRKSKLIKKSKLKTKQKPTAFYMVKAFFGSIVDPTYGSDEKITYSSTSSGSSSGSDIFSGGFGGMAAGGAWGMGGCP